VLTKGICDGIIAKRSWGGDKKTVEKQGRGRPKNRYKNGLTVGVKEK
jgi:hypothetical protein